jgi:hypothetical protein
MNLRTRIISSIGATALLASTVLGAAAATEDDGLAEVTINANANGTLSVSLSVDRAFDEVTYNLTSNQPSTGSLTVTATDDRGTLAGWNVRVSGEDFAGDLRPGNPSNTIAIGNLNLSPGQATTAGVGTLPSITTPVTASGSLQKIWQANAGEGDGVFVLPVGGNLNVPAGTLADTYESTITVDISGNTP